MVTDAEIQRIVETHEAGVADVLEAYERAEMRYMAAVVPSSGVVEPPVIASATTSTSIT